MRKKTTQQLVIACIAIATGLPTLAQQTTTPQPTQMTQQTQQEIPKMSQVELQERGRKLREFLEPYFERAKGKEGTPFTAFNVWLENKEIEDFFPIGMSFDDATVVLKTAGFQIRPRPLPTDPKFRFWFGAHIEMPTKRLFFGSVHVEFEPDEKRLENVNIKSSSMSIAVHGNSL